MPYKPTGRPRGRPRHPEPLAPAEQRVLGLIRTGLTNAEVAERLGLSVGTVKYHVSNMLAKLELADRRDLATWEPGAMRQGWSLAWLPQLLRFGAGPAATAVGIAAAAAAVAVTVAVLAHRPAEDLGLTAVSGGGPDGASQPAAASISAAKTPATARLLPLATKTPPSTSPRTRIRRLTIREVEVTAFATRILLTLPLGAPRRVGHHNGRCA
jgi:DNA-binding CsgD family transcriptional regulator